MLIRIIFSFLFIDYSRCPVIGPYLHCHKYWFIWYFPLFFYLLLVNLANGWVEVLKYLAARWANASGICSQLKWNECIWLHWWMLSSQNSCAALEIFHAHANHSKRYVFYMESLVYFSSFFVNNFVFLQTTNAGFSYFMMLHRMYEWNKIIC